MTSLVRLDGIGSARFCHHHKRNPQVGSDGRLVLVAEPLVHILVHERGLADTAYTPLSAPTETCATPLTRCPQE